VTRRRDVSASSEPSTPDRHANPPRRSTSLATATAALLVIVVTAWLATAPRAEQAQTGMVKWFNNPPQPVAAIFAVVNPLCRPIPLIILGILFIVWVVLAASQLNERWELVRAAILTLILAEVMAQIGKQIASQPRPLAVIPGIDNHGYPTEPLGNAYPSAHAAAAVALIAAIWPWTRWPQRVVGVSAAILVALNRLYIGAHWPVDILGGAAIGMLAASITWLVARRWPIHRQSAPNASR
jgi:membrane-associated phospholipid phosphatase